jgi:microcystin-dependent protein
MSLTNISLEGFLVCNGAAVSRTDYKELFDIIGTRCGAADGVSTFDLPNYPVQYRSSTPVKGMAMCPSSRLGLPVSVVVPFDASDVSESALSQKPQ